MIHSDLKKHYSRFLKGHEGKLHFAAHSHHFWPDVTREAQLAYWDDCAQSSDEKWSKIFEEVIPETQGHIARILNLKDPTQIAFAPNTHELATRILSLFVGKSSLTLLTTTSEFHSWKRQILRLKELPEVKVEMVSTADLLTQRRNFIEELKKKLANSPDIFFISQVFFDSGIALTDLEIQELYEAKTAQTIMVVDGYHGFAALPTDLSQLEGKIFYLAGGYKYAQAGEGVAFMVVPQGDWRPAYTGWFAEYADLARPKGSEVGYSRDGMAFMGATQDPSGLYRFNASWNLFTQENLNVLKIHHRIKDLQELFLAELPAGFTEQHELTGLYTDLTWHGHFLTFEARTEEAGKKLQDALRQEQILIDRRGTRLRFGFGMYHDAEDIKTLSGRLKKLAKK